MSRPLSSSCQRIRQFLATVRTRDENSVGEWRKEGKAMTKVLLQVFKGEA